MGGGRTWTGSTVDDIMSWNLCNMFKCNPSKTEIIHFSSRFSPTYGDRSFAAIAPKLWNQLPLAIRQSNSC